MNYWISVLFRIIPLAMGAICLGYGWYIWDMGSDANTYQVKLGTLGTLPP